MKLTDFDFDLPKELIAQQPSVTRDSARLMVINRKTGMIVHDYFYNLPRYLQVGDLMVFNDTKVLPVRLLGKKESGGKVEIVLLPSSPPLPSGKWNFLGKNMGRARKICFEHGLVGEIENGRILFNLNNTELLAYLDKYGQVPYPPYIKAWGTRELGNRYQTVYAKVPGSAAAPTAGFHFSEKLIKRLRDEEIKLEYLTLHVGLGTFAPVKIEEIEDHEIHSEFFSINNQTISQIQRLKDAKMHRLITVGTTTVRALETWARSGEISGETEIYIYPGFEFKVVDAMVTNFHMPKSSLVLLVAAFTGKDLILKAYKEAIKRGYRFGSFGDAMLIY